MAYTAGHSPQIIARINVTPIIDVALVLVIILLVTAPMLTVADLPVNLPQAHSRGAEDERNLSITLAANGETAVDRQLVDPQSLQQVLRAQLAEPGNSGILVVVRADAGVPYARVGQALEEARAAGATRLAIATRQKNVPAAASAWAGQRAAAPSAAGPAGVRAPQSAATSAEGKGS
jgi:biopolymer transport protein TolR